MVRSTRGVFLRNLNAWMDRRLNVDFYNEIKGKQKWVDLKKSLIFQMALTLSWKDSRLEFHNLNSDTTMNSLTTEEKNEIWIPTVIFDNTVDRFQGRFDEIRSIGTLSMLDGKLFTNKFCIFASIMLSLCGHFRSRKQNSKQKKSILQSFERKNSQGRGLVSN